MRLRVAEHRSPQLVRAALGDDVDDAAGGLAELGLVAARLHLNFLDEVVRRGVAERAERARIGPQTAVTGVGDVRAVNDVLVLETGAAGDRGVRLAGRAGTADARRQIERLRERAAHRDLVQLRGIEVRADRGGGRVDRGRAASDLNGLRQAPDFHRDRDVRSLAETDVDVLLLSRLEPLKFRLDRVDTRRQERRIESTGAVRDDRLAPLWSCDRHRGARYCQSLRIQDAATDGARGLLGGCQAGDGQDKCQKQSTNTCVH